MARNKINIPFFSLLAALLFFAGCGETGSTTGNVSGNEPNTPEISEPKLPVVELSCGEMAPDEYGNPLSTVILKVDGKETLVDTIQACGTIEIQDFPNFDIPNKAIAACGGWWAGAGDYFYVIRENDGVAVYGGWQDEMQEDEGYHWEKILQQ